MRNHLAITVKGPEGFIPDLMINNDKFSEVRNVGVFDHHLPTTFSLFTGDRIEIARTHRFNDECPNHSKTCLLPSHMAVEGMGPFLLIRTDIPFENLTLPFFNNGIVVGNGRSLAGCFYDHTGAVNG